MNHHMLKVLARWKYRKPVSSNNDGLGCLETSNWSNGQQSINTQGLRGLIHFLFCPFLSAFLFHFKIKF